MAVMEGDVLLEESRAEEDTLYVMHVCAPQQEGYLLNYLVMLYLHGVCFSRGSLPISEDSPIVSTQYIYNEKRSHKKHFKEIRKQCEEWQ